MRIAVAVLACALTSCSEAKPTEVPSARASAEETADSAPKTDVQAQVEALKNPAKQSTAVKRLWQFFEDAMVKDNKDRSGPNVKALLDQISAPLDTLCLDPAVKGRERSSLVKLVADLRDPRTEACFKKTLEDYAPDTTEEDVEVVLRAVAALQLKSLAREVMKVFTTVQFARPKVVLLKTDLANAVLATVGPAQEGELVKLLDAPIPTPDQDATKNQMFWQTVSARALGELKSEKAVRPLMKLILTPAKTPIANTALVALVKIGKPSVGPAERLLRGEDVELVAYAKEQLPLDGFKEKPAKVHVQMAAQILGALGSASSTEPLVAALEQAKSDTHTRVIVAVALTQLPRSDASVAAFKKTFEELEYDVEIPAGNAKEVMIEASSDFFDPTFAGYLAKSTTDAASKRAPADDVNSVRVAALVVAIKVMSVAQLAEVEKLSNLRLNGPEPTTVGRSLESELKQAKAVLAACKDEMACYFAALTDEHSQDRAKQFTAIKAAYMMGSLGRESDRAKLLDALPRITNDAVRYTALKALKALAPKGDIAAADQLIKLYTQAEQAKDDARKSSYRDFTQVAAQLRLRAQ